MANGLDTATITIICASVSGLIVNLLQYFREGRQHRWQVEQSERDHADRRLIASAATAHADSNTRVVGDKIDVNTEISKAAFHEANNANLKIAAAIQARDQP